MAMQMTKLCQKGVDLIWKQCDEELFSQGIESLEMAAREGDAEALFFLGHCYSWGDGAMGFNETKAYECYLDGAIAGSCRCVLGALRAGQYGEELQTQAKYTLEESFKELKEAAEEGDAFSAYQLARAYEWEDIFDLLPKEDRRAQLCLPYYEQAAEGGIADAMVKAGKCWLSGRFTRQDREKAMEYAKQAAALGHAWGLYHMGLCHQEAGHMEAAFEYFLAASHQGDSESPYYLGRMYLYGTGVHRSTADAIAYFETAAVREETKSLAELGDIFYKDERVEREDEKAFYWYSRAYAAGDHSVALPLGHLYLSPSKRQDCEKAFRLFVAAAEEETDGAASLALGNLYREGVGCEQDMEKAIASYEKGAQMGNAECMELLGGFYFDGEDGEIDYAKAFYWLDQCLRAGSLQSYSKLAYLYLRGLGCQADESRAEELFVQAAQIECDGYAFYELGYMYECRDESQESLDMAAEYYEKAIEMGNESAIRRFSHFKRTMFGKWKVIY